MTTNLFNLNLQEVPEADYVCYSFKIPYEPLANLFAKASEFKGTRFFWQTPDKNVGFLGFGRNLLKKRGNWSTEDLINAKQEFLKNFRFWFLKKRLRFFLEDYLLMLKTKNKRLFGENWQRAVLFYLNY